MDTGSNSSLKILIATGIYPPSIGGPATYSKLLYEELPQYGIKAQIISFDEVRHLPKIIRHISYFLKCLHRAMSSSIVYAQDPVSVGLPALFAARILRKKFLLKIVGDYAWEQGTQRYGVTDSLDVFSAKPKGYVVGVGFLKFIQTYVAKHADGIIVPSNYLKGIVTNWGIVESKITVIYNAFEGVEAIEEERAFMKAALGISGTMIISAGRLVPWKGFEILIDCVAELAQTITDIKLFIAGEGPDKNKLEQKVSTLNLGARVIFLGRIERKKLLAFIKAADAFVLNTGYEGLSHQLLEVLAIGTPIVTTNIGGNPEVIAHHKEGVLVAYNDKAALEEGIAHVLTDKIYADGLIKNGRNKVVLFNKERMLSELVERFKAL
jgi:glycosyltransferase involved in cell wall biosynthesis